MLTPETESIISKLFLKIADEEVSVEEIRLQLSDNKEYNPFQVFKSLDYENKNYIDEFNLMSFLKYYNHKENLNILTIK